MTEYGHLVETFAVGEILRQVTWSDAPVTVGHFRTAEAQEVDLVLERDDGMVFAFEIKAGTRVTYKRRRPIFGYGCSLAYRRRLEHRT